jgi:peroxiredoxin
MKRFAIAAAAASLVMATFMAGPALAALAVGAKAPPISAKAYLGGKPFQFTLASALKKGPVVLYFFPGAYTGGCNIEAHAFADAIDQYKASGATVIGITGGFGTADRAGAPAANLDEAVRDFSSTHCNGKFPVAVATTDVITAYDSALTQRPGWSNRTSYVIAPNGEIVLSYANLSPEHHVDETLAAVKAWRAAHPH